MHSTVFKSKNSKLPIQQKDIHIVYGNAALYDQFSLKVPQDENWVVAETEVYDVAIGCTLLMINQREKEQGRPGNLLYDEIDKKLMMQCFAHYYKPEPDPQNQIKLGESLA